MRPALRLELLDSPGYTPSVRDVGALLDVLVGEDEARSRRAEAALARLGEVVSPDAVAFAAKAPPRQKWKILKLLGRTGGREARSFLEASLEDEDGKVRRWATSSFARLAQREAEPALIKALARTTSPTDLRAVVAALGKVGGEAGLAAIAPLLERTPPGDETARVVQKARVILERGARRGEESGVDVDARLPRRTTVRFSCRRGLQSLLLEELEPGHRVTHVTASAVDVLHSGSVRELFGPRTALSFAFHVEVYVPEGDPAERIAQAVLSPRVRELLARVAVGVVRFRLAFAGGGHRRALVFRAASLVNAARTPLVNDPTDSTWSFEIEERSGGRMGLFLTPKQVQDPRFAYRLADVPAASHPTIAAALARAARALPDDVVWDPFCGSGLELAERALLGPYRSLHGSDVDPGAVEITRRNLESAGVRDAELLVGDAKRIAMPRDLSLVLTNPPLGRRVARGEHHALLETLLGRLGQGLAPGGRLVWISPSKQLEAVARASGLSLEQALDVDLGGFTGRVERWRRP